MNFDLSWMGFGFARKKVGYRSNLKEGKGGEDEESIVVVVRFVGIVRKKREGII